MTNAAQRPSNIHIKIPLGLRQLMACARIGRPMENVDELASEPSLPVLLAVSKPPIARFQRNWDFLAVLLCC